jgi:NAD(P)-dependent dehydrogenase (short-subunit alcohol dehydrogenase family)
MNPMRWTTENIPDLSGKVIVVTGGNSGLGFESVKAFVAKGAEVILASRVSEKGEKAKSLIIEELPNSKIIVLPLDLTDLNSIKEFAKLFKSNFNQLDVLLNNAGIMMSRYDRTKDGFESQIGTNHLGHFALTGLLLDILIKTPKSRVVTISSNGHKYGRIDFSNLLYEQGKGYSPLGAYARSKLCNLLFTYELQRRFGAAGIKSISVAAHPGVARTNLGRFIERNLLVRILKPIWNAMAQSATMGALSGIRASVDPDVKSAEYGPDGYRQSKGYPVLVSSSEASYNISDAEKLWEESERLTGIVYKFK